MDWSYLAGFFDGEGHVSIRGYEGRRYPVANMGQRNDRMEVLEKIQRFLADQGIHAALYERSTQYFALLNIDRYADVAHFLEGVVPHLIVKRKTAEAVLQMIREGKWRGSSVALSEAEIEKITQGYVSGSSMFDLKKEFRRSSGTIHNVLKRSNLPLRSKSLGVSMARKKRPVWRVALRTPV